MQPKNKSGGVIYGVPLRPALATLNRDIINFSTVGRSENLDGLVELQVLIQGLLKEKVFLLFLPKSRRDNRPLKVAYSQKVPMYLSYLHEPLISLT